MRYPRFLALLLALCLLPVSCLAQTNARPTLNVYFYPAGSDMADLPLINQALNEYLRDKFDYDVQLVMPGSYTYHQTVQAELTQGRQIDIAFCNSDSYMEQWQKNGWLCPLDELLAQEGQGIMQWIDDPCMVYIGGSIYGVSSKVEQGRSFGFEYNLDIARQYGIDLSQVSSVRDLTAVFEQVKQRCPGVFPTVIHPGYFIPFDTVSKNPYGVLMHAQDTTIQNLFETDVFWNYLDLTYQWAQQGYTYDRLEDSNFLLYYMTSGKIFGALCTGKPGFAAQETFLTGHHIGYIELVPYTLYYRMMHRAICYVIPSTSRDPLAAMRLLNLFYTDSYLANLMIYGLEGKHYRKTTDYSVQLDPDSGYSGINNNYYCNQYVAYTFDGAPESYWQDLLAVDAAAPRSSAFGFLFDPEPVERQILQCDIVLEEYIDLLFSGQVDPRELREEFLSALNRAGIGDIIAEKQRQFDLFLAGEELPE